MTSSLLFTICCLFIVAFMTVNQMVVNGQSCSASTLISTFSSSQASSVQCQIGYAADNQKLQCRPYDTVFDENYGKPCNSTSECSLSFVCSDPSKVCVPSKTRKLGESCLARESCVDDMGCFNGVCTPIVTSYEKLKGEKCYYTDYVTNKYYDCARPYSCLYTYPNYRCYERVTSGVGEFCNNNETTYQRGSCISGTSCDYNSNKCVPIVRNASQGEDCVVYKSNSYIECKSSLTCYSNKCYSTMYVGAGETCGSINSTSYTLSFCSSTQNLACSKSVCVRTYTSPLGGYCGVNSTDMYSCVSNSYCFGSTCVPKYTSNVGGKCDVTNSEGFFSCNSQLYCFNNTCMENGQLGQSCEHKTDSCISGLVCRSIAGAPKTCENPGGKYANCTSSVDCQYGLSCIFSKCSNLGGKPVGEVCYLNSHCDSGLCLNNVCSLDYNSTSCSSDSSCSTFSSKCSCGSGQSTSSSAGKCASIKRCQALMTSLSVCLKNNARSPLVTSIFDKYSSTHKACAKEFSQYYSCMRIGLTDAGNIPAANVSGLNVYAEIDIDPSPAKIYKCSSYYSTDSYVCSSRGDCIANEVCSCYSGYSGVTCQNNFTPQKSNPITPNKSIGNDRNGTNVSGVNMVRNSIWVTMFIIMLFFVIN